MLLAFMIIASKGAAGAAVRAHDAGRRPAGSSPRWSCWTVSG
ncbi:hypothetical protein ABLN97_05760 [Mycobacterium tuberculosis]